MSEKAVTKDALLAKLKRGASNGQSVNVLATSLDTTARAIRTLVSELRLDGHAICAHPSHGYFLAATQEELQQTLQYLRERALHSLKLYSRLKNAVIGGVMVDDFSQDDQLEAFA